MYTIVHMNHVYHCAHIYAMLVLSPKCHPSSDQTLCQYKVLMGLKC